MTVGLVRSQGTKLYFSDTINFTDPTLVAVACATGITGLGGAADQIEVSCLDTIGDKEYLPGLGNSGPVNVPFNYIPRDTGHVNFFNMKQQGTVVHWMIALSDGTDVPTVDTDFSLTDLTTRSFFKFDGYVADVNMDIANNDIVKGTLTIQRSGSVQVFGYTPT